MALVRESEVVLISSSVVLMISYHQEASPMERMIFIVLFLAMKSKKLFPTYYKSGGKSFVEELCHVFRIPFTDCVSGGIQQQRVPNYYVDFDLFFIDF